MIKSWREWQNFEQNKRQRRAGDDNTGCVIIIDAFQHIGKLQQYIRDFQ